MQTEIVYPPSSKDTPAHLKALPDHEDVLIAAAQVPEFIGLKSQTLARWRHESFGPKWVRLGRRVFYRSSDLREWIDDQVRHNTIDA